MFNEIVFTTHVDKKGALKEGKERFACASCGLEDSAFITDDSYVHNGIQRIYYECVDCGETTTEIY